MVSRVFKGIPSLQEVECSGRSLEPEMKLLSLQIHRLSDSKALASLNIYLNACVTLGDFSSCLIDSVDTHNSRLMVLVDDLSEGERRGYGCTVVTVKSFGTPRTSNWTLYIKRNSKCFCYCLFIVVNCFQLTELLMRTPLPVPLSSRVFVCMCVWGFMLYSISFAFVGDTNSL